jgi:ABC-type glycerol-3-phosphate transport system substrate-binding protein
VPYLRSQTEARQLERAAAALGGTEATVKNAVDILSLLMLQNGVQMVNDARTAASFGSDVGAGNKGAQALNFYLQFANTASPYYTWNEAQPYSLDAVASGRTAMIFGYHEDIAALKKKNPFTPIGVAPMPQLEGAERRVDYAKYWGLAVSKQTTSTQGWAWDFLAQVSASAERAKVYTDATKRPPAPRQTIMRIQSDPEFGVFARQALTAASWYQADQFRINMFFNAAIARVLRGEMDSAKALRQAQEQVDLLMSGR